MFGLTDNAIIANIKNPKVKIIIASKRLFKPPAEQSSTEYETLLFF